MKRELDVSAHGVGYKVLADDEGLIGRKISGGNPYEAPLLEHIYDMRLRGVAIDVGAHIGNHALWLAAVCGLKVVAFEPDPEARADLWHNVELNLLHEQVEVRSEALGATFCAASVAGKGRLDVGVNGGPVQVRPLDSYGLRDVSVIKIDVEDMEPQVLIGAQQTLDRERPVVFAEARNDECHKAIADVLRPWGYRRTHRFASRGVATPVERWDP